MVNSYPVQADMLQTPAVHPTAATMMQSQSLARKQTLAKGSLVLAFARALLLDFPLTILFASFLMISMIRHLHDEFYRPLYSRSQRSDLDLLEEYTYYERQCTDIDISTHDFGDLLSDTSLPVSRSVDIMLEHGGTVIPKLLQQETFQNLRDYLVYRNQALPDDEEYPVSQGFNRLSYGIDPTEHPAVTQAIREVTNNPFIRGLLQQLLGDVDPASAEITAITNYYGCPPQVYHMDTKQDGNALKFARTYSHSYSLFLPLQNTTRAMGMTDFTPGTQSCVNDMESACEKGGLSLADVYGMGYFPAGDAALLNQHVWHRSGAHVDPDAEERIVFIMSFMARPDYANDPRQLSRGTYFHQKWNMWGHTWRDLMDPMKTMQSPFSILRCLRLWKPPGYNWGYDLVTSSFMRFSNGQLEADDFSGRFLHRLDKLKFPNFLRGSTLDIEVVDQRTQWETFLVETIDNIHAFLMNVNMKLHIGYIALILCSALFTALRKSNREGAKVFLGRVFRLILIRGLLLALSYQIVASIHNSKWGRDILSGRTLMRPFPPVSVLRSIEDGMITTGPTTLPQRSDVLIGTRYDAQFLGSYERWLDYHPGNKLFRKAAADFGSAYATYLTVGSEFAVQVLKEISETLRVNDSRILQQDYRTGDWRVMEEGEAIRSIHEELLTSNSRVLHAFRREIRRGLATLRFGPKRSTALARLGQVHLWRLNEALFGQVPSVKSKIETESTPSKPMKIKPPLKANSKVTKAWNPAFRKARSQSLPDANNEFQAGTTVWCHYPGDENWFPAVIATAEKDTGIYSIAFEDGDFQAAVAAQRLRKYKPLTEGDEVLACSESGFVDCYPAKVLRVMPTGNVDLLWDNEYVEWNVPPQFFYRPPFAYIPPEPFH